MKILTGVCLVVVSFGVFSIPTVQAAKTKLEVWSEWSSGQIYEDIKLICAEYQKKNPNVAISLKAMTPLGEKIKVSTTVGISPDVTIVNGGVFENAARFAYFLKPLDAYIRKDGLRDKFLKAAIDLQTWEGTVYALPFMVDPNFAMAYNADAFAEVGLPNKAPETPDDVLHYSAKLLKKDANGKITRMGMIPWRMYGEHTALINWGFAWGTNQLSDGKHYTLTSPNILKALDFWIDFGSRFGGTKPVDTFGAKDYSAFNAVAMQPLVLPNLEDAIKKNKNMKINLGEMPSTREGVTPTWLGGHWLGIGIHSKHTAQAWDFIKFAATDMNMIRATKLTRFAGIKEAYTKKIYTDNINKADKMSALVSFYSTIVPKAQAIKQAPLWDVPGMTQVIRKVIIDGANRIPTLTDYQNRMNKRIDDMLKKTVKIPARK